MKHIFLSSLFIFLFSLFSCKTSSQDQIQPQPVTPKPPYKWTLFSMGADLSYVNEIEDFNGKYYDSGVQKDPFKILARYGCNTVRVRLWYNPEWLLPLTGGKLYSNLEDVEKTISRAKQNNMAVNLDFHYSDTWADPDHQETPGQWTSLNLSELTDSVYQYTFRTLKYLGDRNLTPEMVQIGNEINSGMLFPTGQVINDNWSGLGFLLKSGIKAVRDFSSASDVKPLIIIHVAQFQNLEWWMDGIVNKGGVTDFDVVGVSHYVKWSTMNRPDIISDKILNIRTKYKKKVMVTEVAYPWTGEDADTYTNIFAAKDTINGYPATVEGQRKYLHDLVQTIISAGGCGLQYWEPAWITSQMKDKWGTGSAWDNATLFDFSGNALKSINFMNETYIFSK